MSSRPVVQPALKGEEGREGDLVAAADKGLGPYFEVAGYRRLGAIALGAASFVLVAQNRLKHQDYLFGSLAVFVAFFILSLIPAATPWGVRNRARSEARGLRRSANRLLRRNREKLEGPAAVEVEAAIAGVDRALAPGAPKLGTPALQARNALDAALDKHLASARKSAAREYTESIGGAILVALLLRAFAFEPFHIPSGSMIPTLLVGDFIFVNKMSYGLRIPFTDPATVHKIGEKAPQRGDVVVFIVPSHPEQTYVKRVIGLPGETISIQDGRVSINGRLLPEPYKAFAAHGDMTAQAVPPGQYFVMGDNRDVSDDSRYWGDLPRHDIIGRAVACYWPPARCQVLR